MQQIQALLRCSGKLTGFAERLGRQQLASFCSQPVVCLSTALQQQKQLAPVQTGAQAFNPPNPHPPPWAVPSHSSTLLPSLHLARQCWAGVATEARTQGVWSPQSHSSRSYAKHRRPGPAPRPLQQQQQQEQEEDAYHALPPNESLQTAGGTALQTSEPGTGIQASETSASTSDIARVVGHPALIISRAIEWCVVMNQSSSDMIALYANSAMMRITPLQSFCRIL